MAESKQKVRLQKLRDFTVQIRRLSDDAIVGTGIAVSTDGKIVTCAHVVEAAIGVHPRETGDAEIGVYFPQLREGEEKLLKARVTACFPEHDDDVALLRLIDGPSPLNPEQFPTLGMAEDSILHKFMSFGYPILGYYNASFARGTIIGSVPRPEVFKLLVEPVQLESSQISPGMSGSAVLDIESNLVVGIVSETCIPDATTKHRNTAWAVNARVLSLEHFDLKLLDGPFPLRAGAELRIDIEEAKSKAAPKERIELKNAPPSLVEWVGRVNLLKNINGDWAEPERQVTGLIGFGGEGKSCLARHWLDKLLSEESQPQPDGVFWWGFYESPSVDEFFEAALKYMSGGKIDPRGVPSSNAKAQIVAAMLGSGKYLFVLDGLEVMQHQEGDRYGLLKSKDFQEFLEYFSAPEHNSFCLITSRAPLLDLMEYTTYTHRDVTRLSTDDGRDLLRKLEVKGSDDALNKVVKEWDGHALTISLLGAHIADNFGGDISKIEDIDPPTANEPRYERVHRVLRRYDEHLSEAERAFLTLFSVFRTPVEESAFEKVFRTKTDATALNAPITELSNDDFKKMIERLVSYRILRYNFTDKNYTTHPLIRAHYSSLLREGDKKATGAHERIKDYYLSVAGDTPDYPTLENLKPLIEVVHHACAVRAYDEAYRIHQERINQSDRFVIIHELGAYETGLVLMQEFFPDKNISKDPLVSDLGDRSWILNEVGLCLMSLGRLAEAVPFYKRAIALYLKMEDWKNASIGYSNLADLYVLLGELADSAISAREGLTLARRAADKRMERDSIEIRAWTTHLLGNIKSAIETFKKAESLEREIDPDEKYLYSLRGIQHADQLRRIGDTNYARRITKANLEGWVRDYKWPKDNSQCHRVLGDLDADAGDHGKAKEHYDEALRIARSITRRDVLIEAMVARGRWYAGYIQDAPAAFNDLDEALNYAVDGGYRIHEADIRNALAWAHIADDNPSAGKPEAERAKQMSEKMGYYWGQVDADEVLQAIENF